MGDLVGEGEGEGEGGWACLPFLLLKGGSPFKSATTRKLCFCSSEKPLGFREGIAANSLRTKWGV